MKYFLISLLLAFASPAKAQMTPSTGPAQVHAEAVLYIVAVDPLPQYARWYAWAEQCTHLTGNYRKVRWYLTPAPWQDGHHLGPTYGMWQRGNRITLNYPEREDSALVIHEIVHDLASYHRDQYPDSIAHPHALFDGRCAYEFHP